ncbi:MAG: NADH-quinone oxidoreductase subunit C, partial [Gemmatimonadota bacterium]
MPATTAVSDPSLVLADGPPPEDPEAHPTTSALRRAFGESIGPAHRDAMGVPVIAVEPSRNLEVLRFLREDPDEAYDLLADVMGVDLGGARPLQVWYQLWSMEKGRQVRIVCHVPLSDLSLESVSGVWRSADWLEREVYDLFGITFRGHPDLRRILMPENYEEGFPLRKDFPLRGRFARAEQTRRALAPDREDVYAREELARAGEIAAGGDVAPDEPLEEAASRLGGLEGETLLLNLGPQHPATHGVLRLVLELDGETVVRCIPHIGYLHTGFEKTCEYRDWNQVVPYTDRMDYLAPIMYNIAYANAVESLLGVEITSRCRVVRVILNELNRILGHLLWIGTTGIDLGAFSVFLYTFQERERIYNLHEAYCGARITTSVTRIGGMLADLPSGWIDGVREFARGLPGTLEEVERLLSNNAIWLSRTIDVGVIDGDTAVNFGLTGPNLRASGVAYDVRKARPYLGYDEYEFDVPVGE